MSEFLSSVNDMPSTPEQVQACIDLMLAIDSKHGPQFTFLPVDTDDVAPIIKTRFPDAYVGGVADNLRSFDVYETGSDVLHNATQWFKQPGHSYQIVAFGDQTATYHVGADIFGLDKPAQLQDETYEIVGGIELERSYRPHSLPIDIKQRYTYEVWRSKTGALFLQTDTDGDVAEVWKETNERGRTLLIEQIGERYQRVQVEELEALANGKPSIEEQIEQLKRRYPDVTPLFEDETNQSDYSQVAKRRINELLEERAEGQGIISNQEAEAVIKLLQQLAEQ